MTFIYKVLVPRPFSGEMTVVFYRFTWPIDSSRSGTKFIEGVSSLYVSKVPKHYNSSYKSLRPKLVCGWKNVNNVDGELSSVKQDYVGYFFFFSVIVYFCKLWVKVLLDECL